MGSIKYYLFTRFIGVILLQIVFVVAFAWFSFEKSFQHTIDENFRALISLTENIEYFYTHQIDEFKRLTEGKGFIPYQQKSAQKIITDFIHVRGLISTVHYYKASGDLEFVATARHISNYKVEKSAHAHQSLEFREAFVSAVNEKKTIITPPLYTKTKVFYHVVLQPVFDSKKQLQGILSFAFFPGINPLHHFFAGLSLFKENFLALTDSKGNIIATTNVDPKQAGPALTHSILHRGKSPDNPFEYIRKEIKDLKYKIKQTQYYLLSKRVNQLPFFAVMGVNEKIFLDQKKRLMDFILALTAISALIGIFASIVISRKVSQGIEAIILSVKELKLGKFKKKKDQGLHRDFKDALHELDDLSVEIQKGKLLGNLWGQGSLSKHDKKNL